MDTPRHRHHFPHERHEKTPRLVENDLISLLIRRVDGDLQDVPLFVPPLRNDKAFYLGHLSLPAKNPALFTALSMEPPFSQDKKDEAYPVPNHNMKTLFLYL